MRRAGTRVGVGQVAPQKRVNAKHALHGWNTDVEGFARSLAATLPGWTPAGRPAAVVGAGGAARAVIAALLGLGVSEIRLVNRGAERAEALAGALGGPIRVSGWSGMAASLGRAALLVGPGASGIGRHDLGAGNHAQCGPGRCRRFDNGILLVSKHEPECRRFPALVAIRRAACSGRVELRNGFTHAARGDARPLVPHRRCRRR
jgi:hypothetical protein